MIFASPQAEDLIQNVVDEINLESEIVIYGKTIKNTPFDVFLECNETEESTFEPFETKSNKETGVVFFSSGTTGMPKGICTSHYGLMGQALSLM